MSKRPDPHPAPATPAPKPALRWIVSAVLLSTLGACANYSGIAPTAQVMDASPLGLSNTPAEAATSDWWLTLDDPQLVQLIRQAIDNSPNLHATQARLALAQAQLDLRDSATMPQVGVELDDTRQLFTANTIYPPPFGGSIYEMGTLQLDIGWELDFFGKNSAALAAAVGQTRAVQADLQAARGLLAFNVAHSYYQLTRLNAQLQVVKRTLAVREQMQKRVAERLHAGLDTRLEFELSRGALPDVKLQIEQIEEQKALTLHALAALSAQPVSKLNLQLPEQPEQPELPALRELAERPTANSAAAWQTLPLNLLGLRADIAAARWRVEAAQHEVKSAKAQFYPNVNLVAYAGYSSIGLDKLLQNNSQQWGVGPAITLPLFDAGRLRAQLRGKTAELDAAIESYNAQLFSAVHEVSDSLTSTQAVQRQQVQQRAALNSAERALQIAQQRFDAGLVPQLAVLQAELPVLAQQRQAIDLNMRALDTQVQLLHAVGAPAPAAAPASAATNH